MGYIPTNLVTETSGFEIEIIGKRRPATILHDPILDPSGSRMRS
jgi:dimethylglycine dehydrogenase